MKVRIVVPRRSDGGERDRLWDFCSAYWRRELPEWEIAEGHHGDGPFNRSRAINLAAEIGWDESAWDVAVILDGDTILDIAQVIRAVEVAHETGKLVLPFETRKCLNADGTRRVLEGHRGSWERFVQWREGAKHVSSCVVVPRRLWDEARGFDERFEGWGGEDDAFHAACLALAGVERLSGSAWHLWHKVSPWRDHRSPLYRQALALCNRYRATTTADGMRGLIAESRGDDQVLVVVITNNRRDTLETTIRSAEQNLHGPIGRRLICVDGGTAAERAQMARHFPGWTIQPLGGSGYGYGRAVIRTIEHALGSGQPWIFWLEDDFTFEQPVDLPAMQALMGQHPEMVQLSLMRQPWYDHELEAGGVIDAQPEAFEQRDGWVAHRAYWTSNPMLCRRSFLAQHHWPTGRETERKFGFQIFRSDPEAVAGIFGHVDDPPRVLHIGEERAGRGY